MILVTISLTFNCILFEMCFRYFNVKKISKFFIISKEVKILMSPIEVPLFILVCLLKNHGMFQSVVLVDQCYFAYDW